MAQSIFLSASFPKPSVIGIQDRKGHWYRAEWALGDYQGGYNPLGPEQSSWAKFLHREDCLVLREHSPGHQASCKPLYTWPACPPMLHPYDDDKDRLGTTKVSIRLHGALRDNDRKAHSSFYLRKRPVCLQCTCHPTPCWRFAVVSKQSF